MESAPATMQADIVPGMELEAHQVAGVACQIGASLRRDFFAHDRARLLRRETQPHGQGDPSHDGGQVARSAGRSEEHTSELQSLMRISYAVFCLKKKNS